MGFFNMSCLILLSLVFSVLSFKGNCDDSQFTLKFFKAPHPFSHLNSAKFVFQVLGAANVTCSDCSITCKLDDGSASDCGGRKILYSGLQDGNHSFGVCVNGSQGAACTSYNWTVDTVPPTAYITSSTPFTNALNVSVNISFTESCSGGGGFRCSSVNDCNLLVYGAGQVVPSSLTVVEPNLKYLLLVSISSASRYGRLVLVMDTNFCTDAAGNPFARSQNSSFYVHYDQRNVFVDLRAHVPEKLLQLRSETRTIQATNNYNNLKVYLYFSAPILNSSTEILSSLSISKGTLLPITGENHGNRRFGFMVANISNIAIITISFDANSTISRQGTLVSPVAPVTFLYDSQRTAVRLSTTCRMRTREHNIPISIKFMKPVFGFNSSLISISGGRLQSFHEISRSIYAAAIQADDDVVSVSVPENVTGDVAGNKNLASNVLRVRHYTIPVISSVISIFVTAIFLLTCFTAGLLTMSTASLQSVGAFSRPSSSLSSDPTRILFRSACHIQIFALSRWLPVTLPVEYYEFARSMEWSIPYFSLPWETGHVQPVMMGSSPTGTSNSFLSRTYDRVISRSFQPNKIAAAVYGSPLTPVEYRSFFESQSIIPEAEYISDGLHSNGWRNFDRSMFWLAVIGGSLILLHAFLFFILKYKKRDSEKQGSYGALIFPRFEIFLVIVALPCICQAAAALIAGGTPSGVVVGILLLGVVAFLLLSLFLFLSVGITFGKLLQYKEVHREGQQFHWYQELIRVTLGPGKRGQWTWKNEANSVYLTMFGPLFEDLRGPPKYMVSQISGSNLSRQGGPIIASDDETEDAEAPFIQKLFGILRIYYTMLESARRATLGILAGAYLNNNNTSSKTPIIILLCLTSFQLFFLVLKKPFIKKKVQLVEIISLSCEVAMFATCFVLLDKEFSTTIGIFMLTLFLIGFLAQMSAEGYALYEQTKQLDTSENKFFTGLKIASVGFLLYFVPQKLMKSFESTFPVFGLCMDTSTTGLPCDRNSSSSERAWPRQLREMAKASFSKDGSKAPTDPSSSKSKWSGLWGTKRSGSSSLDSSLDYKSKSKSKGLYKDLEAIFASNPRM
ncbi:hypothetical protein ES319_D12G305200v1 [Gossypium barbadense]|uniref:Bacterial Ig-like domain-containing protein n=2 Tax=Gossypium TaxID=3633 RepID=A0A5J5P4X4_GOSBA|nr:hypothetical protein ES319_D12G305200v1 [Gossypium barbadense]TYG43204.1 hypothetical protein ES288_D12G318700v1 [Gossypium darwinii]